VILNNLGIAERQIGLLESSKRRWTRAERLLSSAGEGRSLVKIACNLAVVEGHRGRRAAAEDQLERARRILLAYPGERLEFFVRYTRAVVAHLLGDAAGTIEAFEEALPLGKRIGDAHLVRFGQVLLAEAFLASGRLAAARRLLQPRSGEDPPLLARMAAARRLTLASLLGNERALKEAAGVLDSVPRSEAAIPEAWNDLHRGLAALISGKPAPPSIEEALAEFRRTGAAPGERFALALLLADAIRAGDRGRIHALCGEMVRAGSCSNRFLAIVEPLVIAQARLSSGDSAGAREALTAASSESIGSSSLELDWLLELARARIALGAGDPAGARRHVHRGLQARELLAALSPRASRERFRAHARFRGLLDLARRLERIVPAGTPLARRAHALEGMVGRSRAMARVFESVEKLRGQDLPVLIRGETGTGKDLLARALHATSSRPAGPYQTIHCAALPEELLEAELFGHEAGAFTGAAKARPGLLEVLAGGTLLLDQVEHLSPRAQAKLLHAAGAGRARRLGSSMEYAIDVRFLSSTSIDLRSAASNSFRRDLFFRLAAVEIEIPPLRERLEDLSLLAGRLLEAHARRLERGVPELTPEALELLEEHGSPGNVRELEAVLFRSLLEVSGAERIGPEVIGRLLPEPAPVPLVPERLLEGRSLDEVRREVERAYVLRLHREAKGDLRAMMAALGVRRTQLYELLRKLGLDVRALRESAGDEPR
jgi:DNA-binding NtrC family response regulator